MTPSRRRSIGPVSEEALKPLCIGAEPEVRIHLSPANSPSLARFYLSCIEKPAVTAVCAGPPRRHGRRDTQGSSISRQLPVTSLSGAFPVPQRRLKRVRRPWSQWCANRARVAARLRDVTGSSSVRLRQCQARSAARASQVADMNVPAACLRSDRAADGRRGWPR